MKPYLASREPSPYLYDLAADYPRRGGKMMRPSICIATARAFGARSSDAVRSAVAIELLHNAFLVHDDIEDESEMRRGEPALHSLHGVPLALNAGDAMLLLSLRPLLDNRAGPRLPISPSTSSSKPNGWRENPPRGRRWSLAGGATT